MNAFIRGGGWADVRGAYTWTNTSVEKDGLIRGGGEDLHL